MRRMGIFGQKHHASGTPFPLSGDEETTLFGRQIANVPVAPPAQPRRPGDVLLGYVLVVGCSALQKGQQEVSTVCFAQ